MLPEDIEGITSSLAGPGPGQRRRVEFGGESDGESESDSEGDESDDDEDDDDGGKGRQVLTRKNNKQKRKTTRGKQLSKRGE